MKTRKTLSKLMALVVALTMCLGVFTVGAEARTRALYVVVKDTTGSRTVTRTLNLNRMNQEEYSFSGINNQGTVKFDTVKGVTLTNLLTAAGMEAEAGDEIVLSDGESDMAFDYSDAFGTRYYYANLEDLSAVKGPVKTKKADKVEVPAVLAVVADKDTGDQSTKFYIGQAFASERNWPKFWDGVKTVTIQKAEKERGQWAVPTTTLKKNIKVGTKLSFDAEKNGFVYYTVNGKKPTEANAKIYNYAPKNDPAVYNTYKFKKAGKYTVKAVVRGFGKKTSEVVTFTFNVKKASKKK